MISPKYVMYVLSYKIHSGAEDHCSPPLLGSVQQLGIVYIRAGATVLIHSLSE